MLHFHEGPPKRRITEGVERIKKKAQRYSNPQSLSYMVCALTLCYNRCPMTSIFYGLQNWRHPLEKSGWWCVQGLVLLRQYLTSVTWGQDTLSSWATATPYSLWYLALLGTSWCRTPSCCKTARSCGHPGIFGGRSRCTGLPAEQ